MIDLIHSKLRLRSKTRGGEESYLIQLRIGVKYQYRFRPVFFNWTLTRIVKYIIIVIQLYIHFLYLGSLGCKFKVLIITNFGQFLLNIFNSNHKLVNLFFEVLNKNKIQCSTFISIISIPVILKNLNTKSLSKWTTSVS